MKEQELLQNSIILEDMLECSSACGATGFETKKFAHEEEAIDWLFHNLPTSKYVIDQITNYIFSNGLTTGDEQQDEKLNAFLYAQNVKGTTNLSVIREAVRNALIYQKSGIRFLSEEGGIINVCSRTYACLTDENEEYYGFDDIIAFLIATDGRKIYETDTSEIDFDRDIFLEKGAIYDKDKKLLVVPKSDFINLRSNTTKNNGESPLAFDQKRLKFLTTLYERLIYDLEYDGPGRILFQLNDNYAAGGDGSNEIGTTQIVNQSTGGQNARIGKAKKEAQELGRQIKDSKSDSVILYSNIFKGFEHLPRVTQAKDFLEYLDNEGVILSQVIGVSPTLIGLGKISGNVSMEKIIDNAMLNEIIPMREKFAVQISAVLADKIGVDKIYFDKYEMKQSVDDNDKRMKVVTMIQKLKQSGYDPLADKMAAMLEDDLDAGGKLKTLKTTVINRLKKLFSRSEKNE